MLLNPSSTFTDCTWANRPINPQPGDRIRLTDHRNIICAWDGTCWAPATTRPWIQSHVPVGIPSGGTIGANGALTSLTTAFPFTYTGIYLYFPANAIGAGVPAGLYWTEMTSGSVGTIYNNVAAAGDLAAPAVKTPFVGTAGSTYVQPVLEVTLRSYTLPAGIMGPNGALGVEMDTTAPGTATVKARAVRFGGITAIGWSYNSAGGTRMRANSYIRNMGVANAQWSDSWSAINTTSSGGGFTFNVDTNAAVAITETATLNTSSDYVVSQGLMCMLHPGA